MLQNVRLCKAQWWIQMQRLIFLFRRKRLNFFLNKVTLVLLDNSNFLKRTSAAKSSPSGITVRKKENGGGTEELSEDCVLEALEKTSKVIRDIESLLAASGKWSPVFHILTGAVWEGSGGESSEGWSQRDKLPVYSWWSLSGASVVSIMPVPYLV